MKLQTIDDIADVKGKKILLRVDFNVTLSDGKVQDDTRIREALPTINELLDKGAALIACSHLKRPKGKVNPKYSLAPVANRLEELLGKPIKRAHTVSGQDARDTAETLQPGEIMLLENTRFLPGEESNSPKLAKKLAEMADIFISDAFAAVHRAHTSTVGVAKILPSYAGRLIEREISMLEACVKETKKPLVLIIGGAKIDTKIGVVEHFLGKADTILVGGGLANTFLSALQVPIGASLCETDQFHLARDILELAEKKNTKILLPLDAVCGEEYSIHAERYERILDDIKPGDRIFDIGPQTIESWRNVIEKAGTILWNGPMGVFEFDNFSFGTKAIAEIVAKTNAVSILGGGDTIDAIHRFQIDEGQYSYVSTGGGAMLEFLEGKELPGISVLCK